jgi:hypothetical protein
MDAGTIIAIILGVVGIAITVVIWIASTRAVKSSQAAEGPSSLFRAIEESAVERAQKTYEGVIDRQERELAGLNKQVMDLYTEVIRLNRDNSRLRTKGPGDNDDSGPQSKIA